MRPRALRRWERGSGVLVNYTSKQSGANSQLTLQCPLRSMHHYMSPVLKYLQHTYHQGAKLHTDVSDISRAMSRERHIQLNKRWLALADDTIKVIGRELEDIRCARRRQ